MTEIKFWRYALPSVDGVSGWGIFLMDSTGMFSCVTDYGNYAFKWTHHGMKDFREFFIDRSFDYHVKKLFSETGGSKEFRPEETVERIKEYILEHRRDGYYTEEQARKEWDLVESVDWDVGEISKHEWYEQTSIQDGYEYFTYDYPARVKALRDKLFPRFSEMMKLELEKEKVTA